MTILKVGAPAPSKTEQIGMCMHMTQEGDTAKVINLCAPSQRARESKKRPSGGAGALVAGTKISFQRPQAGLPPSTATAAGHPIPSSVFRTAMAARHACIHAEKNTYT